jgi:hypothetical protein
VGLRRETRKESILVCARPQEQGLNASTLKGGGGRYSRHTIETIVAEVLDAAELEAEESSEGGPPVLVAALVSTPSVYFCIPGICQVYFQC